MPNEESPTGTPPAGSGVAAPPVGGGKELVGTSGSRVDGSASTDAPPAEDGDEAPTRSTLR